VWCVVVEREGETEEEFIECTIYIILMMMTMLLFMQTTRVSDSLSCLLHGDLELISILAGTTTGGGWEEERSERGTVSCRNNIMNSNPSPPPVPSI
jgi:hypothetical protein